LPADNFCIWWRVLSLCPLYRASQGRKRIRRGLRLIVGYAPGGGPDIAARLMAQWWSERLGQPFIIENRPGAGSTIGTEAAVHAPPDGYTLLPVSLANATNATLNYNFVRDITPVAGILRVPNVMEVNPAVPVKTVPESFAYAKANPGKLNMASAGNGSPPHVAGELYKMMTGVNMQHVPYRSRGAALTDLLGGQVQVTFESTSSSIEYIRSGTLAAFRRPYSWRRWRRRSYWSSGGDPLPRARVPSADG
jgi:tripartite-type tricarboxylate transporter receptor subunit TctC